MSVSHRSILQICGGTCVIRRDFLSGLCGKIGGGFRVHWSGILAVRGAKNWVLSCCSYVRGKKKHLGECHQCTIKKRPNDNNILFVCASQIPCLFWVKQYCGIHVLQLSLFYCHILQSIIGPGEENATWKVKFSSEILQLRFKIKSSFCQGQTPPQKVIVKGITLLGVPILVHFLESFAL